MLGSKEFPTLGVLGVYTGRVLEDGGFSDIHDVMDHFYPGIMTIGCAIMAESARKELIKQHPELAELPECTKENCKQWAADALDKFGPTISLEGFA